MPRGRRTLDRSILTGWVSLSGPGGQTVYELMFLTDDGIQLDGLQYESKRIAMDQAQGIASIRPEQWEEVSEQIPEDVLTIRWDDS
jgi:hypothetical protein